MIKVRELIWAAIIGTIVTIVGYAGDARIDQRVQQGVQQAIDQFQVQTITRQLDFYTEKKHRVGLSPDDQINEEILQRQLQQVKEKK